MVQGRLRDRRQEWAAFYISHTKLSLTRSLPAGLIMVFGEITTRSPLDYQKIIRDTIKRSSRPP